MKTTKIVLLTILYLSVNFLKAQTSEKCYDENTHIINVGIGFGGGNYYHYAGGGGGYAYKTNPLISVSYEQAFKQKLGPGFLGLGGYFGYRNSSFQYNNYYYNGNNYYYKHSWNYYHLAIRGAYHLDFLTAKNAEVYFGTSIGMRFSSYKFESNSPDPNRNIYEASNSSLYPTVSVFAGARWYFVPKVGLYAEAGYGLAYVNGGFSFKF
ncbi:MAG: hypothetical protein ABIP51_15330 [Bacteroidia bacterium]